MAINNNVYAEIYAEILTNISEKFKDILKIEGKSSLTDDEFLIYLLKATEEKNVFNSIINKKLIETKFGNPEKEDLDTTYALFTILESVFGLDAILSSRINGNVLNERFSMVMESSDPNLIFDFANLIENLYIEMNQVSNYENIKEIMKNNREKIEFYVKKGLENQQDEKKREQLVKRIEDMIGKMNIKKM